MPSLTGRGPHRRHKSSHLYPDVAPEKSRQPVMKLAAAQTNLKSGKSSCYQLSLSPEADATSHGASPEYVLLVLKNLFSRPLSTGFYLPISPRWGEKWLQFEETGTCPSRLSPAQRVWSAAPVGPVSPPGTSNPPPFPPCCSTVGSTNNCICGILHTCFRRPFSTPGKTPLIN